MAEPRRSGFRRQLWRSEWILRIESGRAHDRASQLFGRNRSDRDRIFFCVGGGDKTIASSDYRLEVPRLSGIIVEHHANFADGRVDTLLDVDENVLPPKRIGDLLARHQLSLLFNQEHEQLQRETFKLQRTATPD